MPAKDEYVKSNWIWLWRD